MKHTTEIALLTAQRETLLHNASIAHAEGRRGDSDHDLERAHDIYATLMELQGIREPELPGLETERKTNPFLDRALEELKRDAWNRLGRPSARRSKSW
jgi:arylsulfatase A-like enzyme